MIGIEKVVDTEILPYILFRYYKISVREGGDNELFITLVPNFFNNVFLFVGLTTLETMQNFDWLIH